MGCQSAEDGFIIYLISPLDAVPDFIPAGGLLDDGVVIPFVVQMLAESLRTYTTDSAPETAEHKAGVEVNMLRKMQ